MKVYVGGLWHDSEYEPIILTFENNADAKHIGQILVDMPEPNKNFIAYPNDMPKSAVQTIINIIKANDENNHSS